MTIDSMRAWLQLFNLCTAVIIITVKFMLQYYSELGYMGYSFPGTYVCIGCFYTPQRLNIACLPYSLFC